MQRAELCFLSFQSTITLQQQQLYQPLYLEQSTFTLKTLRLKGWAAGSYRRLVRTQLYARAYVHILEAMPLVSCQRYSGAALKRLDIGFPHGNHVVMSFFLTFSLTDDSPCLNKDLHYIYIT